MSNHLWDYYHARAAWITERETAGDWPPAIVRDRAELRRRFLISHGLDPAMPRCDLRATQLGTFAGDGYTVAKWVYQIVPDCWGSANLYRPAKADASRLLPAVLYVSGHAMIGSEWYQAHPIAWARRGYACLIVDTIQQHDNPGDHHALYRGLRHDLVSMGYSSSGGELLNSIRALDLLVAQKDIDPKRIGTTGLSGGGSLSFLLPVADDRIAAAASVDGVAYPALSLAHRHLVQHCDCIYTPGRFGHDVSTYASLIAPRPFMLMFARQDTLFSLDEYRLLAANIARYYSNANGAENFELFEFDGHHAYQPSTVDRIHEWFDRHLAHEPRPMIKTLDIKDEKVSEQVVTGTNGVPYENSRLALLPEIISKQGTIALPADRQQWAQTQATTAGRLRGEVFHLIDQVRQPQSELELIGDWLAGPAMGDAAWRGTLDGMEQRVQVLARLTDPRRDAVVIELGERHETAWDVIRRTAGDVTEWADLLVIEPRAAGPYAPHPAQETLLLRAGMITGMTPMMMYVQDLHHLMPLVRKLPMMQGKRVYFHGKGDGTVAALLYLAMTGTDGVAGAVFEDMPVCLDTAMRQVVGLYTVMNLAHALGLLAPLPVVQVNRTGTVFEWLWANRAYRRIAPGAMMDASCGYKAMRKLFEEVK